MEEKAIYKVNNIVEILIYKESKIKEKDMSFSVFFLAKFNTQLKSNQSSGYSKNLYFSCRYVFK